MEEINIISKDQFDNIIRVNIGENKDKKDEIIIKLFDKNNELITAFSLPHKSLSTYIKDLNINNSKID